jgi:hypothetical protein
MLSTPNPTAFSFTNPALVNCPKAKGCSDGEFSVSGSDHVVPDPRSSSSHDSKAAFIPLVPEALVTTPFPLLRVGSFHQSLPYDL